MGKIVNAGSHHADDPASDIQVKDWYSFPWDAVLRPGDSDLANLSANMAIACANNNNIIYIYGGQSYHEQLATNNNDPSAITSQCGTDCMGMCFANIKGALRKLGRSDSSVPNMGTSNADTLLSVGYTKFTDSDHVSTDAHAQKGDIYVNYARHGCIYVGDGTMSGYTSASGANVNINVEAMSPYIVRIPEDEKVFDAEKLLKSQVCGVALSAGYLYSNSTHIRKSSYIATNLHSQVKCCDDNNMPYALIAEVRAKSVAEAKSECDKLYYVAASAVPSMSLWLHLDFPSANSKDTNNRIMDYYLETCTEWGYANTLGVYVTEDELDRIDWDEYSSRMFLWKVDHSVEVEKYLGVIPFSTYTAGTGTENVSSGSTGQAGEDYSSANAKQKAIVDACNTTPSPGAGLCAAWVSYVYSNAGCGYPTGNACDMYWNYCKYSDTKDLKVGMIVAVPSHPGTSAGKIYGHVAIYIGGGKVMENVGYVNTQNLDSWISYYGKSHTPKWGFAGSGIG